MAMRKQLLWRRTVKDFKRSRTRNAKHLKSKWSLNSFDQICLPRIAISIVPAIVLLRATFLVTHFSTLTGNAAMLKTTLLHAICLRPFGHTHWDTDLTELFVKTHLKQNNYCNHHLSLLHPSIWCGHFSTKNFMIYWCNG